MDEIESKKTKMKVYVAIEVYDPLTFKVNLFTNYVKCIYLLIYFLEKE